MKRFNQIFCLAVVVLLMAVPSRAQSVRDVINTLEIPFRNDTPAAEAIHDVEADFAQESSLASLDRTQQGNGRVTLRFIQQATDQVPLVKFRWEYDRPTRQEIVSDGRTMWVYIPENNQVIESDISEVSEARAQDPLTFLTGLGNLSRDFLVRWASPNRDDDGNYILKLTPKTTTTMFRYTKRRHTRYIWRWHSSLHAVRAGPSSYGGGSGMAGFHQQVTGIHQQLGKKLVT